MTGLKTSLRLRVELKKPQSYEDAIDVAKKNADVILPPYSEREHPEEDSREPRTLARSLFIFGFCKQCGPACSKY